MSAMLLAGAVVAVVSLVVATYVGFLFGRSVGYEEAREEYQGGDLG